MRTLLQIQVAEEVNRLLNTREAASELMGIARERGFKHIEFDFSKVEFMSRSFADQFHKEKMSLIEQHDDIVIDVTNANEEIVNILRIVASTQNKTDRLYKKLPSFKFSDTDLLTRYLISI